MPYSYPSLHPGRHQRDNATKSAGVKGRGFQETFIVILPDLEGWIGICWGKGFQAETEAQKHRSVKGRRNL